jgi:hypothetical protein
VMAGFCSRRIHWKYIHTAFLKPSDPVTGDIHISGTGISHSTVTNDILRQRESKKTFSLIFGYVAYIQLTALYTALFHKNVWSYTFMLSCLWIRLPTPITVFEPILNCH